MAAAGRLRNSRLAGTYPTMIGLLATTGMRVGEAIGLNLSDINWEPRLLLIREGKFGKARLVPLQRSTAAALGGYVRERRTGYPVTGTPALFLNASGRRVCHCNFSGTFHQLTKDAGIKPRSRTIPCSRPVPADGSAGTRLSIASPSTWLSQRPPRPRSSRSASRCTCSVTAPRSGYSTLGSTLPS